MTDLWLSGVFFQALNTPKTRFRPGLRSEPRWGGAYDAPPDLLVTGDILGTLPPHTLPSRSLRRLDLGAFGASVVKPPNTNSWLRL